MSTTAQITLQPLGKTLSAPLGTSLRDILFTEGVEFPCGGRGKCKGCRVRVLSGDLPSSSEQEKLLGAPAIAEGWRLSCLGYLQGNISIELAQWEASILGDHSDFEFSPKSGLGIAVDLGTTTVVCQALDLRSGSVIGVCSALNCQAAYGADIMSRVEFALQPGGREKLAQMIRSQIQAMINELLTGVAHRKKELCRVVIVGNSVMHHLFSGLDITPLAYHPFEPADHGLKVFSPGELAWDLPENVQICFLPCLGSFVGSDILAGILATRMHQSNELVGLIDLGTNGEMVVGNRDRLLCASTAAGPAFEGAKISMGMRASTGAISAVSSQNGSFHCHILGNTTPRGICGSGLVDAVAVGLELDRIKPNGRLASGSAIELLSPVHLTQGDIRELQLAKGAIAAGMRLLLEEWGAEAAQVKRIYLAGAFGNYISRASAIRIGLLRFPIENIEPVGNSALLGAKMALFAEDICELQYEGILKKIRHVSLNENAAFQDIYAEEMVF